MSKIARHVLFVGGAMDGVSTVYAYNRYCHPVMTGEEIQQEHYRLETFNVDGGRTDRYLMILEGTSFLEAIDALISKYMTKVES